MSSDKNMSILRNHELFHRLPDKVLRSIMDKIIFKKFKADQEIFHEGQTGDCLYMILEGNVNISVESKEGDHVQLAVLRDGDYFGEMAMLTDAQRSATATTLTPCLVYSLDRQSFQDLLNKHSDIALELSHVLSERLAYTNKLLLREHHLNRPKVADLKEMPDELMSAFRSQMERQDLKKGDLVFEEGDIGDKLYLIEKGQISITVKSKEGKEIQLAVLSAGDYFGEMAMLTDAPRTATARAAKDCTLYFLHKEDFNSLINNHHVVALELSRVLSQRLSKTNEIISQKDNEIAVLVLA